MCNMIGQTLLQEQYIVKTIRISREVDGRNRFAEIVYLREITDDYSIRQHEGGNEIQRMIRITSGIPEEDYPSDILDRYILDSVRTEFRDANITSSLLMYNINLINLRQRYSIRRCYRSMMIIEPDDNNIGQLYGLENRRIINIPIQIYEENIMNGNFFDGITFTLSIQSTTYMQQMEVIRRLIETMKMVSYYLA